MEPFLPDNTAPGHPDQDSVQCEVAMLNVKRARDLALSLGSETFEHVVKLFIDQANNSLEEMHNTARIRSFEEIASLSHTMKGSASTVGCDVLADLYGKIEHAVKNENSDMLDRLTTELQNATPLSLDALQSM